MTDKRMTLKKAKAQINKRLKELEEEDEFSENIFGLDEAMDILNGDYQND